MLEPHDVRIDDLDPHVLLAGPVRIQSRRKHMAEPSVDPDERPLVVVQVEHDRAVRERPDLTIKSSLS